MINLIKHKMRVLSIKPRRYRNLLDTIYNNQSKRIMEIGTYKGEHASQMIETAAIFNPKEEIEYFGFDLFELLTDEECEKELSKKPPAKAITEERLAKTGAKVKLFMGYTKDTLPKFVEEMKNQKPLDFIYIDGGHSIETIELDWNWVKQLMSKETTVIFDDYYSNDEKEIEGFGCQSLIHSLAKEKYSIEVLDPEDRFQKDWGTLKVKMVKVNLK